MRIFLALVLWVTCGVAAEGFLNAHWRHKFERLYQDPDEARISGNTAIQIVGGPITLAATLIFTNFGADGWTLDSTPTPCTEDPEIWCGKRRGV